MKAVYILAHHEARRRAMQAVADAPDGYSVTPRCCPPPGVLLHEILEAVN